MLASGRKAALGFQLVQAMNEINRIQAMVQMACDRGCKRDRDRDREAGRQTDREIQAERETERGTREREADRGRLNDRNTDRARQKERGRQEEGGIYQIEALCFALHPQLPPRAAVEKHKPVKTPRSITHRT